MKAHSVKSNAKRAARKLCERYSGIDPAEPVATDCSKSAWFPAVQVAPGCLKSAIAPEVSEEAIIIVANRSQLGPEPVAADLAALDVPAIIADAEEAVASIEPASAEPAAPQPLEPASLSDQIREAVRAPRTKSTPEEIAARREARRKEIEAGSYRKRDRETKTRAILDLCRSPAGATIDGIMSVTGWQRHTVRGFMATLKTQRGVPLRTVKDGRSVTYHLGGDE